MIEQYERIRQLIPHLEAAVYDSALPQGLVLTEKQQQNWRRRRAVTPYCLQVTRTGGEFLKREGIPGVRAEYHLKSGPTDEGHKYLTIPQETGTKEMVITPDDLVIDPFYLQFAGRGARAVDSIFPNIFLGPRSEIVQLMGTPDFSDSGAARFYQAETWVQAYSRK